MQNDPNYLLKQAQRCRNAATTATNPQIRDTLMTMARDYEDRAQAASTKSKP